MIGLAALKEFLKVDEDITADDVLILEMEAAAVEIIQNETGRYFGPIIEITEILSGNGWAPVWLRADPIEDEYHEGFVLDLRTFPAGDWELQAATAYEVDGGRIYPLSFWTPGRRTLRATYWAGFEEGDEPADVQMAVKELVAAQYEHRKPFAIGTTLVQLPYSVQSAIRAHRIPTV